MESKARRNEHHENGLNRIAQEAFYEIDINFYFKSKSAAKPQRERTSVLRMKMLRNHQ